MKRIVFASTLSALLAAVLSATPAAQGLTAYREFTLGATVASVASAANVPASAFRTLHEQPARLQEFAWRPSHYAQPDVRPDSVDQITFSFYNDQLSRMVVAYDSRQTAAMTSADLVAALTAMYGQPTSTRRAGEDPDFGPLAALWQSDTTSVELFRGSDAWRLVLTSRAVHARARAALAQAVRRLEQEAPARERAELKAEEAAERARQQEMRRANTDAFQP